MSYYLKCSRCGRVVSSVIPGGAERVAIRAWIECPECIAAKSDVEQRIAEAVAAEREACCAVNAKLLEACEALVVRIDEWMALDMPCPLCDGYVPHFDDCPYTFAAAATIRTGTGEGEQGKGRPAFAQDGPMQSPPKRRPICP